MKIITNKRIIHKCIAIFLVTAITLNMLMPITVLADNNKFFDKNITYKKEELKDEGGMGYTLYTPSTAKPNDSLPLVIWLHGGADRNYKEYVYKSRMGPKFC